MPVCVEDRIRLPGASAWPGSRVVRSGGCSGVIEHAANAGLVSCEPMLNRMIRYSDRRAGSYPTSDCQGRDGDHQAAAHRASGRRKPDRGKPPYLLLVDWLDSADIEAVAVGHNRPF